jgi:cystathionine beta-lyase
MRTGRVSPAAPGTFADDQVPLHLLRTRAFNQRWAEQPLDVIPLTAADPDFAVAPCIRERLVRWCSEGVMSYGPPLGLPAFREAVAAWMQGTRGLRCGPADVLATDGAASAMATVARASLQPGDEVLIPDPVDFLFRHAVERAGAVAVPVALHRGACRDDAAMAIAQLKRHLGSRSRMLWLCNPHNPLGLVPARAWLEAVVHWAIGHGLRVLSDEVWSDIVYAPHRHTSAATLSPEAARQVVMVYGFSKGFGLAGLRIGCIVCADPAWLRRMAQAAEAESTVGGAATLSQVAAVAAMEDGGDWLRGFVEHLRAQRDLTAMRIARWPGVQVAAPQGTFVMFPRIDAIDADAERLCTRLLAEARVALVPGSPRWFGPGARGHLRLCFATSRGLLERALDRLDTVLLRS